MCIVSLAWQAHSRWKLIVIGNRDEMHTRPSKPLARWEGVDHLLAGKDVKAGGTWLGVSEQGRCAVVTNLTGFGMPDPSLASRGDLLKDYLTGKGRFATLKTDDYGAFNPFNLISIAGDTARIHSNRPDAVSDILPSGIHGLSNGPLSAPWPKSHALNDALQKWFEDGAKNPEALLDILNDRARHHKINSNPEGQEFIPRPEHSPIFIEGPVYGTRCSTVVAVDHQNRGTMIERRYHKSGEQDGESCLDFKWPH